MRSLELDERGARPAARWTPRPALAVKRSEPPGFRWRVASRLTNVAGPRKVHIMASSAHRTHRARRASPRAARCTSWSASSPRGPPPGRAAAPPTRSGAVRAIGRLDASGVLLVALALGLAAYAAWRFAQAVRDLDGKGGGVKGLAVRAGYAASGLGHLGLAFTAARLRRLAGGRASMRGLGGALAGRAVGRVGGRPRRGRRHRRRRVPVLQGLDRQVRGAPAPRSG